MKKCRYTEKKEYTWHQYKIETSLWVLWKEMILGMVLMLDEIIKTQKPIRKCSVFYDFAGRCIKKSWISAIFQATNKY